MSSSADGSHHPLKLRIGRLVRFNSNSSTVRRTTGRGGSGNATTFMLSPSQNSLAQNGIRSPSGRDIRSVPRSGQSSTIGRGGAGNSASVKKASKRRVSELETRAALAVEREVVQQRKRERESSSSLVTGRGGMGNVRKSKQDKSKLSPTLSHPSRSSMSYNRSLTISPLVLDISGEASTPSLSRLGGIAFHRRSYSVSDLSLTETQGTTFPSLSFEESETDHPRSVPDSTLTDRLSYTIPESTFGALAEAHQGIASDHWTSVSTKCYARSPNSSLTDTDGGYYHRRVPTSVAPFEEPPLIFDLTPMKRSQRLRHRSMSTNPPKVRGSRPPTWKPSTSGASSSTPSSSSLTLDKHYTPGHRTRPDPVTVLPPEQDETPIEPLSPPPRLSSSTSDFTLALPLRSPPSAGSTPRVVSHQTTQDTYGFRERSESRLYSSDSGYYPRYHPSNAGNATEMGPGRSYKQKNAALRRLVTPTTVLSHISGKSGAPSPALPARTVNAEVRPAVRSPMRPIKIPDTPPQIPISVFVDTQPHRYSMGKPSPNSPLAPSFRSTTPTSQYESFTPTFGTTPLPPLPAAERRATYTSFAGSDYTLPSPPTSAIFVMEEEIVEVAQLETP